MRVLTMALEGIKQRHVQAQAILGSLRQELQALKSTAASEETARLMQENKTLKSEIGRLKDRLVAAEVANGVPQVGLPGSGGGAPVTSAAAAESPSLGELVKAAVDNPAAPQKKKKEKKEKKAGKPKQPAANERPVDISRLKLRIGLIREAKVHPDADGLYVETVELGEEKPRTILSGLVKNVPIEEMQMRKAMFMVNLKPAKMRGIFSEGMIMCASTPEKVEILECPDAAEVGDIVTCPGYDGEPDDQLNPKKKIFEQVAPDLKVNSEGIATYKGIPLEIPGKGTFRAPSLKDCPIK